MNARTLSHVGPLLIAAVFLSPSSARATTYVVRPDGSGQFPTIQAAVSAAAHGDTVELTSGTFTGEGNRDIYFSFGDITVRSENGNPADCIIDCQGSHLEPHRGFYIDCGCSVVLEGITISNGCMTLSGGPYFNTYGGGVFCNSSSGTIRNCIFADNEALFGGGVCCYEEASFDIVGCTFTGNIGVAGAGAYYRFAVPALLSCTFANNSGSGMSIDQNHHLPTVSNSIFAFNDEYGIDCRSGDMDIDCCNVFGNSRGDWVGCFANQLGANGNISEDPLFCDAPDRDFSLHGDSPCAPEQSGGCGLIGALPVGCAANAVEPTTWGAIKASFKDATR